MQHHNQIHKQRSKTILDHTIQKQDYSWSCKAFSSSLSTWTLLASIHNPVLIICDRRERAPRYEYRTHIISGLLASPSLLSSPSPPSSPSRLPCSHLASFPPRLSENNITKENCCARNFPIMRNIYFLFCNLHLGLICHTSRYNELKIL